MLDTCEDYLNMIMNTEATLGIVIMEMNELGKYWHDTLLATALYRNQRKMCAKLRDSEKIGISQAGFGGALL